MEFWNVTRKGKIKGLGISMKRNSQKKKAERRDSNSTFSLFAKLFFVFRNYFLIIIKDFAGTEENCAF